jgi:ABC-type protease/lipase transport system fused ATPase/permease subunit
MMYKYIAPAALSVFKLRYFYFLNVIAIIVSLYKKKVYDFITTSKSTSEDTVHK